MEAGAVAAGNRQPLVVIVVAGAAGAATGQVRAVAYVHLVLGLAAASFALCVTTLHPQLKQQEAECAATEENAVAMRTHGMLLLLSAGTQAAVATVAAFAPVSWRPSPRIFAAFAHAVSALTYFHFINAFVAVAFGCYPVSLDADSAQFIAHYVLLMVPLCVFFGVGVAALVGP